jgi:hypothetical protein
MRATARRPLLVAAVGALSITALIAIVALLAGDFGDTQLRILGTTAGFGLGSLLAARGTALLEQGRYVALGRAVPALAALAFLFELWLLWLGEDSPIAGKTFLCTLVLSIALAQIAGMVGSTRPPDPPSIGRLIPVAGAAALVATAMTWAAAIGEIDSAGYYRILGAVVVLDAFLVALQPVVRRLGTRAPAAGKTAAHFTLLLQDGRRVEHAVAGDLPASVAQALRSTNEHVVRIEFPDG